jgi:hypothetical protein
MPNTKITNLTSLTAASGDEIPVNRAGSDGKISVGDIGAALASSYTVTGSELVTGGDLAIDPSGAPGWTLGGSPSFAAGSLTWTYVASPISASITVPVTLTSGSYYVIEIHQTVTGSAYPPQMLFFTSAGFFQRNDSVVKAVFRASATGSDSFFMSTRLDASGHEWVINSVSIKEIDAPGVTLSGTDSSGTQLFNIGDLNNVVIGHAAGAAITSGNGNVAIGDEALYKTTTGFFNIAIGQGVAANATSNNNTGIGARALTSLTTGGTNTALGRGALDGVTTGSNNVGLGFCGNGVTTGSYNIAVGHNALLTGPTTGAENLAVGHNTLQKVTSGAGNIALGAAYLNLTTGSNNIAIGGVKDVSNVGGTLTTGSRNVLIGASLDVAASGTSDYLNIGDTVVGSMASGGEMRVKGLPGVIGITIDGGGAAITTGVKGYITVPYACTIKEWYLTGDTSGAIKIDVWAEDFATGLPDNSDSLTNAHEPEITASGTKASDTDLSDWTSVAIAANDIIGFNVDSCTSITKATLVLKVLK